MASDAVKRAVSLRKACCLAVTKDIGKATDALDSEDSDQVVLQTMLDLVESKVSRLIESSSAVLDALQEKFVEGGDELDEAIQEEMAIADELIEQAAFTISKLRSSIDRLAEKSNHEASSTVGAASAATVHAFKVPQMKLSIFDGKDLTKYPGWADKFKALIDSHPGLLPVQKLDLLKGSTADHPKMLIDGLLNTSENYSLAWKILEENYGDPNFLLGLFVSRLIEMPRVQDANSAAFPTLVYKFEQSHQEIQTLIAKMSDSPEDDDVAQGAPTVGAPLNKDVSSFFLSPLLLSKIPEDVILRWYDRHTENKLRYSFSGLMEFLKKGDLRSRQTCHLLVNGHDAKPKAGRRETLATSALHVSESGACIACQGKGHRLHECKPFLQKRLFERKQLVGSHRRCFNCLGFYNIKDCPSKRRCFHCQQKHHTLLCNRKDRQSENANSSAVAASNTLAPDNSVQQQHMNAQTTTGAPRQTFLQVVRVRLQHPSGRQGQDVDILFDSGATSSWIRDDLARSLGLPIRDQATFQLNVFTGGSQPIHSRLVECGLVSLTGSGTRFKLEAWTAETLAAPIALAKPRPIPAHLKHLSLPETYDGTTRNISMVIGSDYYTECMTGERIRGRPNAVETIFGWTLQGQCGNRHRRRRAPQLALHSTISLKDDVDQLWKLKGLGIRETPKDRPPDETTVLTKRDVRQLYPLELASEQELNPVSEQDRDGEPLAERREPQRVLPDSTRADREYRTRSGRLVKPRVS